MLGVAALASAGIACGGGGGGGDGGGAQTGGAQAATSGPGISTNQAQWQVAMAALAQPSPLDEARFDPAAVAAWNQLLARAWPRGLPLIRQQVASMVQGLAAPSSASIQILAIRNIHLDLATPPQLVASAPAALQTVDVQIPASHGTWTIGVLADVGGFVPINLFGLTSQVQISAPIDLAIADIALRAPINVDLAVPEAPRITGSGAPSIHFRLEITTQDPMVQPLIGTIAQVLDPVVRGALVLVEQLVQQEIGRTLSTMGSGVVWGLGGPQVQALPGAPALEPLADAISEEIQRNHMPHDHVWPAVFDAPQGQQVVRYKDHGDSAFWTGHYLAGEAYRYDVTGDARALAGARRAVNGLKLLLDVWSPQSGLLSRSAIPVNDFWFKDIQSSGRLFLRQLNGQMYGALGGVSRDQYMGFMLGLSQGYHRVPALRADIEPLVSRALAYLEGNDWTVYMPNGVDISTSFAATPTPLLAFMKVGQMVDPARWGALHARYAPLAHIAWFPAWVSGQEVHVSYYKFNLAHAQIAILVELETDPDLYRGHLKLLRMERKVVGHHQNAWFDTVYGLAVPTSGRQTGDLVQRELARWTQRPRRGFSVQNSQDPTIQRAAVTVSHQDFNQTGQQVQTSTRTFEVALYPIPIDQRAPTDYLWQRSPFDLDGSLDPKAQEPGIDLLLPYWCARSHGLLP